MTANEAQEIALIIFNVFEHEDTIDPKTIGKMFQYIGNILYDSISSPETLRPERPDSFVVNENDARVNKVAQLSPKEDV